MAKGKLTKSEKYIIEGMKNDDYSAKEIADEIGRREPTVQKAIDEINRQSKKRKQKAKKKDTPKRLTAKDMIINETTSKRERGVAIMTMAASSRADESRQSGVSRTFEKAVQKIKRDE
jgi:IS30 family transposase|tara:strand:+ start:1880 stop:2233 length:354 start_codon:yes stop_codon:yes gene_type:complete